jgi:MoaA/NifB/PqqE/SkfB family radical SAM enzyme
MEWFKPEIDTVAGRPAQVMLELTNECQLACVTCPRDKLFAADYEIGHMSLADFRHIFGLFAPDLRTLDLTGLGESLLHPDLFEMLRHIRQHSRAHVFLTTNTILLNAHTIEALAADPVDTLCVSIDGTTQAEFAAIRGPLQFAKLKARVREAVRALGQRTRFILCVVLLHETVASMPAFVELAAELGIERVSLKPINLVANGMPSTYYRPFLSGDFERMAGEAIARGQSLGVVVDVFRVGGYQCSFPWEPIYVTWDGYVVPCCAKPFPKRLNFGNLLTQSWDEIKNAPAFRAFRQRLLGDAPPPAFCAKCHLMQKTLFADAVDV